MAGNSSDKKTTSKKEAKKAIEKKIADDKSVSEDDDRKIDIPVIPREFIENLPPETREKFIRMSMFMASGPVPHPLFEKFTPEHISKIIDVAEKDNERNFQNDQSTRKWNFAWLILIVVSIFAAVLIFLRWEKPEYIAPIITAIIAGIGGYGYGISRSGRQ